MSTEQHVKNRNWLWYFIALTLLVFLLLGWLYLFIQEQLEPGRQLKREDLLAAQRLFEQKGPKSYQMLYTVQRGRGTDKDTYFVEVRGGKVVSAVMNGLLKLEEPEQRDSRSMPGLLRDIERFLLLDAKPDAPRTFCRATFDNEDGHLIQFQRQVIGGPERVAIRVEEFRPMPAD